MWNEQHNISGSLGAFDPLRMTASHSPLEAVLLGWATSPQEPPASLVPLRGWVTQVVLRGFLNVVPLIRAPGGWASHWSCSVATTLERVIAPWFTGKRGCQSVFPLGSKTSIYDSYSGDF